jgi:hypothetical protein
MTAAPALWTVGGVAFGPRALSCADRGEQVMPTGVPPAGPLATLRSSARSYLDGFGGVRQGDGQGNRLKVIGRPLSGVFRGCRCPLRRLSGRRGSPGRGMGARDKSAARSGTEPGPFRIKGLAARIYVSFTHSSPPAPPSHPPPRRLPRWRASSATGKGPGAGPAGPVGQYARP